MTKGFIHSIESGAMVDGPGVRTVIFFSGCPLRCQYCHNPDTWELKSGEEMDSSEVIRKIEKTADFLKVARGGVTISGGEPLMQVEFLEEILVGCKKLGLHTALDTSGFLGKKITDKIINSTDLFLVDLKSYNPIVYKNITGVELEPTLDFLDFLRENNKIVWVRFVLVPGLSDNMEDLEKMAKYIRSMPNIELIEILPFHKMGEFKWKDLGLDYKLYDTKIPSKELIMRVKNIFKKEGVKVVV